MILEAAKSSRGRRGRACNAATLVSCAMQSYEGQCTFCAKGALHLHSANGLNKLSTPELAESRYPLYDQPRLMALNTLRRRAGAQGYSQQGAVLGVLLTLFVAVTSESDVSPAYHIISTRWISKETGSLNPLVTSVWPIHSPYKGDNPSTPSSSGRTVCQQHQPIKISSVSYPIFTCICRVVRRLKKDSVRIYSVRTRYTFHNLHTKHLLAQKRPTPAQATQGPRIKTSSPACTTHISTEQQRRSNLPSSLVY